MHVGRVALIALTLVTPISIELHAEGDTLATVTAADGTQFEIMAGTGAYAFVSRGCEGQILRQRAAAFGDAGARVQLPLGHEGLALGVRAGIVRDDFAGGDGPVVPFLPPGPDRVISTNRYLNPYLSLERLHGGVGAGWVFHEHEFPTAGEGAREQPDHPLNDYSAHVRIGTERHHFEVRWMEGVPLASDGGYLTIGVGGRPAGGPWTYFGGLGAGGPYEGAGLAVRAGHVWDSGWNVGVRARLGWTGRANASGVAVGIGWSGEPPRPR